MSTLKQYLQAFAQNFNPDKIEGEKLTDTKSGLGLTSHMKMNEYDFSNTLIIQFLIDGKCFQTWGCETVEDEKLFYSEFYTIENRLKTAQFEADSNKQREARKMFKGL